MALTTNSEKVLEKIAEDLKAAGIDLTVTALAMARRYIDVKLSHLDFDEIESLMERFACGIEKVTEKTTRYFMGKG